MDDSVGGSGDDQVCLSRKEVFLIVRHIWKDGLSASIGLLERELSQRSGRSVYVPQDRKASLSALFHKMRAMWQNVCRKEKCFFEKYDEWLQVPIFFPIYQILDASEITPNNNGGRPSTSFEESSDRSKRRKTEEVRATLSSYELSYAAQMSLRSSGQLDASKVVKEATLTSPSRASKYIKAFQAKATENVLSGDAALSLLLECKLSTRQYQQLRATSKNHHCKLYPPYKQVVIAKRKCYPCPTAITITESKAEVKLQALLDHTVERILLSENCIIDSLTRQELSGMSIICKWGCDGSSQQSEYKQSFSDENQSDANIFFTAIVPLQLISNNKESKAETVIWRNSTPSSTRFCRPLRLQFLHEDPESIVKEVDSVKEEIKLLVPFETVIDGKEISVDYKLALTMIDGKVCNALTSTKSAQCCYICGATSKAFNDVDAMLLRKIDEKNLQFGLSTLHAWIRFLECCLHLSYKLEIKKWQARGAGERQNVENRKKNIQKGFRTSLGLIVDRPKPGYGSTNDGNTARRFFANYTVSASITGLDESLIKRFYVILQVISSDFQVNLAKFQLYAVETARYYVQLYPWYFMPTSVHKVLIHGPQVIARSVLPIGQLSEEAQEASNKDIKKYREDFSRKCSRQNTMEDVFKRLLLSSDPYISSMRKQPVKRIKDLLQEAVELVILPASFTSIESQPSQADDTSSEDESDSNSFYISDSD